MSQVFASPFHWSHFREEVPVPNIGPRDVLIRTTCSLVSAGTERMLVDFGRSGLLAKAQSQPDKLKEVIQKIRADGLISTYDSVSTKLNNPIPMGYSNVGVVVGVGDEVRTLQIGQRVVSNGSPFFFRIGT